jgi:hypothetical protein
MIHVPIHIQILIAVTMGGMAILMATRHHGVRGATEPRKQLRSNLLSLSCLDQELYLLGMTHL